MTTDTMKIIVRGLDTLAAIAPMNADAATRAAVHQFGHHRILAALASATITAGIESSAVLDFLYRPTEAHLVRLRSWLIQLPTRHASVASASKPGEAELVRTIAGTTLTLTHGILRRSGCTTALKLSDQQTRIMRLILRGEDLSIDIHELYARGRVWSEPYRPDDSRQRATRNRAIARLQDELMDLGTSIETVSDDRIGLVLPR